VLARVIYGLPPVGAVRADGDGRGLADRIVAGAIQGYFGGWTDLMLQRIIEIWSGTPSLYVIIIVFAILGRASGCWWLTILFGWPALVGVVRAEFLRARNFEYVRAARPWACRTARSCSATSCPTPWWPP
jgi:microcin C transport system permease protein